MCPLAHLWNDTLNEDCFEALDFVGNTSWAEYITKSTKEYRVPFTSVRVNDSNTNGVLPKGSTWTQLGLPACSDYTGGTVPCDAPMFENKLTDIGIWGRGHGYNEYHANSPFFQFVFDSGNWTIVDLVKIPKELDGE